MFGVAVALVCLTPPAFTSAQRFFSDDPLAREPETQDASGAQPWDIGLFYELSRNLFVVSRHSASNMRAGDVNTVDEVPDSSWFTNRIGARPMTAVQLARGPNLGPAPAPERWVILREKTAGVHPGFTARDADGETWFLSFDDSAYPEGATAAAVIATKLFWALGYNQVETFLTTFDPARAVIDPSATKRRPSGARTPFTREDLDEVLDHAVRREDGSYRAVAGRLLPGKVLGGFRYAGTRPDDPNDIVPHEFRRSLRALRVFGAWANLTDLKAGNTLDTLVREDGRGIVKHVLQDVGSTFGMANGRYEWDIGWEHFYDPEASRRRLVSFGFALSPWQTVAYREYPSIGRFEADRFDPAAWKPQTPTEAYMEMRADDAFWAARRVVAFTDELIRAAVHTGAYTDAAGEQHLATILMGRRNAIGRAYLNAINPVVAPQLDASGTLTFDNAAVASRLAEPPQEYRARWSLFDNATGSIQSIGDTQSSAMKMAPPRDLPRATGAFIEIDISALSTAFPSWQTPVRTFFRRTDLGWSLVGLERLQ
jgi:hypothetical protein